MMYDSLKYVTGFLILLITLPALSQIKTREQVTDSTVSAPVMLDHMDSVFADKNDIALMKNPDRAYRAQWFANWLENEKDKKKARYYYDLLKRDYGDIGWIKGLLKDYNPDGAITTGKRIPPFDVTLLDGSGKVTDRSMLGKYYMIDFWATWCEPCMAEIPYLNKAYEKYKGKKRFEILSFSMDHSEAEIKSVLAAKWGTKWQMPWLNAFIPGGFASELGKEFEVVGLPKPILVGPDGKILAIKTDLYGDELEKTLEQYLDGSN
ncbi:MAG: TlpA family protein disulfide reductase [Candidatus Kapaibacterium sp.]